MLLNEASEALGGPRKHQFENSSRTVRGSNYQFGLGSGSVRARFGLGSGTGRARSGARCTYTYTSLKRYENFR